MQTLLEHSRKVQRSDWKVVHLSVETETNLKIVKMKWIVYQTTNVINAHTYVGVHKTNDPDIFDGYLGCNCYATRPSSYANPETPFQFAVKKYGPSKFKRIVLKVFDNPNDAFALEAEIVNLEFIKRKDTYNVNLGGCGGRVGKPFYQFSLNGELVKTWESLEDAADFLDCPWASLWNASYYKLGRKGFYWSYKNNINVSEYCTQVGTPVYKYDGETFKLLECYESQGIAAKINGVNKPIIQRAVKGGYKVNGFYYSTSLLESYSGKETISLKACVLHVYDLNGNFIITLNNKDEILKYFNIKTLSSIQQSMRCGTQYKGFQFSLDKVDKMEPIEDKRNIHKRVGQYSLCGDLIEEYDTVTKAREKHGTGVSRCLRGQQKQCHGFIFRYL